MNRFTNDLAIHTALLAILASPGAAGAQPTSPQTGAPVRTVAPAADAKKTPNAPKAASATTAPDTAKPVDAEQARQPVKEDSAANSASTRSAPPAKASTGYYREPGSYGTKRATVPPDYVRSASKTGIEALADLTWLDVGLDFRTRYELRSDDLRRSRSATDNLFLFRTRAYFGIHNILDPFRFVVEVEDARSANSQFKKDNRDVNGGEPIQAYAELYFDDLLPADGKGQKRPISLRGGRFWFDKIDRRLIGNNAWRNTTNTFQGVYASVGEEKNDWQLELVATQPLDRKLYELDRPNDDQWFYAAIGHWRRWSDVVTIEPYWLFLDQKATAGRTPREIHSPALRFYGPIGTQANFDVNLVYQTGRDNKQSHSAFGAATELGYTFVHPWKPRWSIFYGYASGDENPNDNDSERFERFFGFGRPWSANDYFVWENFHAPKTRIEFVPLKDLRVDAGYSWYWLASDTDRWRNANLRDPTGQSGDFLGHEFDVRARYPVLSFVDATLGYAHFEPGEFTKNQGRTNASDFLYLELTFNAFPKT